MTAELKYKSAFTVETSELTSPPPYSTTWGNDVVQDEGKRRDWSSKWRWKMRWNLRVRNESNSDWHIAKQRAKRFFQCMPIPFRTTTWPVIRRFRITKKQSFALVLVIAGGIVPLILLGHYTPRWNIAPGYHPFYGVFEDKVLSCGPDNYGRAQNATVYGIENLFVLDKTFGRYSFSQVKTIDVVWDVFVGRGVQLLAWWVAYNVFSDALLRVIERHPASFRIFQRIALEGPSLLSVWTLTKEVWAAKSKRTKALFLYVFVATWYVIAVPMFLSAMTGYDSTTISWVSLDNDNIVPGSSLKRASIIWGTTNTTFDKNICDFSSLQSDQADVKYGKYRYCMYPLTANRSKHFEMLMN